MILDANGVKHKWDLKTEKWVVYEESKETSAKESYNESEEGEKRKERKCGGDYNDRGSYDRSGNRSRGDGGGM